MKKDPLVGKVLVKTFSQTELEGWEVLEAHINDWLMHPQVLSMPGNYRIEVLSTQMATTSVHHSSSFRQGLMEHSQTLVHCSVLITYKVLGKCTKQAEY